MNDVERLLADLERTLWLRDHAGPWLLLVSVLSLAAASALTLLIMTWIGVPH